jgi:hypothetical protein
MHIICDFHSKTIFAITPQCLVHAEPEIFDFPIIELPAVQPVTASFFLQQKSGATQTIGRTDVTTLNIRFILMSCYVGLKLFFQQGLLNSVMFLWR